MEKQHREAIRLNFSSLVEQTDLDLMVAVLYEKGVFSEPMIEPYKDNNKDVRNRKRQLYREITRRGPDAFRHLLDALMENGYWGLVRTLDPHSLLGHIKNNPGQGENSFLSLFDTKRITGKEQNDPNQNRGPQNPVPSMSTPEKHIESEQNANRTDVETSETTSELLSTNDNGIPNFKVTKSTKFYEDRNDIQLYRTRGRRRGVLLLFSYIEFQNNIEEPRESANVDIDNLSYLFTELGFEVGRFYNLKLQETKQTLENLPNGICAERPETVFVVFSSHGYARSGTGDTDIRCSDGNLISYYQIIRYFSNVDCPVLNGIPKVFIFQTCRGIKDVPALPIREPLGRSAPRRPRSGRTTQDGRRYDTDSEPEPEDGAQNVSPSGPRDYSDILIAHSTVPGYVSNRDKVSGSWYIQALCDVFAARAHDTHVEKLLKLVDTQLHRRFSSQTSSVDSWGFNKRLYLHPGLYED